MASLSVVKQRLQLIRDRPFFRYNSKGYADFIIGLPWTGGFLLGLCLKITLRLFTGS